MLTLGSCLHLMELIFPDDYLGIGVTVTYGSNNPDKKKYKADLTNDVLGRYPE